MKRIDRRTFMLLATVGASGSVLSACGNTGGSEANLNPTMILDVAGAPPTLAPQATPGGGANAQQPPAQGGAAQQQPPQGGAAQQPPAQGGATQPIAIEAIDPFAWSVYEFSVAPGQIIHATNVGLLQHTFAVDEWGIDENLPSGQPVEITVPQDAQIGASHIYYCSVPGHREGGMQGTLTVVEAGAAAQPAGAAAQGTPPAAEATPVASQPQPAPGGQAAGGAGQPVVLEAIDPFAWSVYEFSVSPGQVIQATNTGLLQHTFAVDEWGIDENLPSGQPVEITVPQDAQVGASHIFYCSVPGHKEGGMQGTLTVV